MKAQLLALALRYVVPLLLALTIGGIAMWLSGYPPISTYAIMLKGSLSLSRIPETLLMTTPLIFTGLSFLFADRCGLFNVGAEGQLLIGGFAAAWVGFSITGLPPIVHVSLALLAGALAGAFVGFIPGALKARLGANEVVTTIMLNYICADFTEWLVLHPFAAEPTRPQTKLIEASAQLPSLIAGSRVSAALFVGILAAFATWFLLRKTVLGYEVRAVGLNATASARKGIHVRSRMILAMSISGAIAGLGGAGEILGTYGRFIAGFSPGYGFDGIAVALVGASHPLGALPAAFLFGALRTGGTYISQFAGVPSEFVVVIQALVILFVTAPGLIERLAALGKRPSGPAVVNEGLTSEQGRTA